MAPCSGLSSNSCRGPALARGCTAPAARHHASHSLIAAAVSGGREHIGSAKLATAGRLVARSSLDVGRTRVPGAPVPGSPCRPLIRLARAGALEQAPAGASCCWRRVRRIANHGTQQLALAPPARGSVGQPAVGSSSSSAPQLCLRQSPTNKLTLARANAHAARRGYRPTASNRRMYPPGDACTAYAQPPPAAADIDGTATAPSPLPARRSPSRSPNPPANAPPLLSRYRAMAATCALGSVRVAAPAGTSSWRRSCRQWRRLPPPPARPGGARVITRTCLVLLPPSASCARNLLPFLPKRALRSLSSCLALSCPVSPRPPRRDPLFSILGPLACL